MDIKEYRRAYYLANKEKSDEYHKRWVKKHPKQRRVHILKCNRKKKTLVLGHYSFIGLPECAYCGIRDVDVLCLDHIDNDGGGLCRREGSGIRFYTWIVKNNFPAGYQVLCANCNLKKEISRVREVT